MTEKKQGIFTTFLLHLHPRQLDKRSLIFSRTFGLGGISALLTSMLFITGLWLKFHYLPTSDDAYYSILKLQSQTQLGQLIRNLHFWSAQFLIIASLLHLARVFLSSSIFYERKRNWYYGLSILIIILATNFTGYLLPWDQLAFWAVTVVTEMPAYIPIIGEPISHFLRGGPEVGQETLFLYYNLHTGIFPILLIVLVSLHFYLVRKAKGVTIDNRKEKEIVASYPNLVYREALTALILLIVLFGISFLWNAPLLEAADPNLSPEQISAPWYFAALQELLIHNHPLYVLLVIPLGSMVSGIYVAKYAIKKDLIGNWFYNSNGKQVLLISIVFSLILNILFILVNASFWSDFSFKLWINFPVFMLISGVFLFIITKKFKAEPPLLFIGVFAILMISYLVLTLSHFLI
jgi:quinol-cytochrome oxidoreductase complex cytochrome b subunit